MSLVFLWYVVIPVVVKHLSQFIYLFFISYFFCKKNVCKFCILAFGNLNLCTCFFPPTFCYKSVYILKLTKKYPLHFLTEFTDQNWHILGHCKANKPQTDENCKCFIPNVYFFFINQLFLCVWSDHFSPEGRKVQFSGISWVAITTIVHVWYLCMVPFSSVYF